MINIKSDYEIELLRKAGHIVYLTHKELEKHIKPGITTLELDNIASKFIESLGATASFKDYDGYPKSICTSINDEVVHGIPGSRKIKNGDVVSIDLVLSYKGYHADATRTYIIGNVSDDVRNLVIDTKDAFYAGVKKVKDGARVKDISRAIEDYAHAHGLSVVEELCGHGIGLEMHEDPDVPNFDDNNRTRLKAGMVIAIEPMLNLGSKEVALLDDDWTVVTKDGKPSSHYENTVLVTKDGYEILTGD